MGDLRSAATLHDGHAMPWLGLGVWQAPRGEAYDAVRAALDVGYRHVDTAKIYGNEREVGRAVRESGVPREEIFVTTKLWNADHGHARAKKACEASLGALGLDYVDLYLIHFPMPERTESWRALVELQREGKCRSIGVSNFTVRHLEGLLAASDVVPAVNQVEMHPFLHQRALLELCAARRIQVEAYSPLVRGERMDHPVVQRVAGAVGKTAAQVLLRWGLQRGMVVIPKSVRRERIAENAGALDFTLDGAAMAELDALDEGLRTCWDPTDAP